MYYYKKTFIENFNTSQTVKTVSSYTVLIYFNTFVNHMGSRIT